MEADLHKRARAEALTVVSRSLSELLAADPEAARLADAEGDVLAPAALSQRVASAYSEAGPGGLRLEKRRLLAAIAARDAAGELALEGVGASLAELADACLRVVVARRGTEGMAIIAMGKLGGRELNYYSDVDVMFVTSGDVDAATKAAGAVLAELGEFSPEGRAYEIDTNLRPEGRNGPLVRSLDGYLEYYRRWAKPWEFQALIKARHAAGDATTGATLIEETRHLVYPSDVTPERIASIRKMKERVETHGGRGSRRGPRAADGDDVKLGPGGIRDIEFSVQLLQLVHGGGDPSVRGGNTLDVLHALAGGGYIADDDERAFEAAYRWLRTVEHRLQLWQERRVRHLPRDEERRAGLARSLGFSDSPGASAADRFDERHRETLLDVRSRFDKVFYRPMVESLADAGGPALTAGALGERLRVLGFRDVERAARVLDNLVGGTSRRAKLFRVLTPALLRFLASAPQPDAGLFSFLRLGESLENRLDVLGALRDNPPGLEFLARVLGSGRLLGEVLEHVPEELATIARPRDGWAKDRAQLTREAAASLDWRDPSTRLDGLRRFKRREMLRVALADVAGDAEASEVGAALADIADACLEAALGDEPDLAVIGMGKLGGRELSYSSDVDVMFVAAGDPLAAEKRAEALIRWIGEVTPEGQAFRIDAALRPEGKSGPLTRSVESFTEYYERRVRPWELLALLKARAAAGDGRLASRYLEVARPLAYPSHVPASELVEIRHLKARMERERIPRGTDPRRNFKLGPGGLSDIEFAVQIVQRLHAHDAAGLRTTSTPGALAAARTAGLIDEDVAALLARTYSWLTRLRNRLFFMTARPVEALPVKPEDLEALGIAMGFEDQPRQELEEHYLRTTRRARRAAEPLIYG